MFPSFSKLSDIQQALKTGEFSCYSLVTHYLEAIHKNAHLNAVLEVFEEEILAKAKLLDEKIKANQAGRLAGLVIGLKDNLTYKGHKVGASSKILEGYEAVYNATVVERLLAEDALIIARLNCDEFAMGASNENSAYGPVLNFADTSRVSGGSSGGAAVAVQAGMCHASLGSDTGGSVRQPAAFCGLWGYKPSYGMVSRYGLLAYASSFDQVGPITQSAEDLALIMDCIAGPDAYDATLIQKEKPDFVIQDAQPEKLRIAVFKECVQNEGVNEEIRKHTSDLIQSLEKQGHSIQYIDFPMMDYLVPCYYALSTAEASSNFARYTGLLYGYRSPNSADMESMYRMSRSEGFGTEVKRRIMLGTFVLSSEHVDAYYTQALKVRQLIKKVTDEIFSTCDFILSPTTTTPAFKLGEKAKDPLAMYLADIFTVHANIVGIPAISIPTAHTKDGLPFGMQLMSPFATDATLIQTAHYLYNVSKQM